MARQTIKLINGMDDWLLIAVESLLEKLPNLVGFLIDSDEK